MEPVPPEKSEERYPIGVVGTRSAGKVGGKVPNRGCCNPYRGKKLEKGTQSGLLEPVPPEKSEERYPIGVVGTRSAGKVGGKVPNRGCCNPYRGKKLEKGIQSGLLEPVPPEKVGGKVSNRGCCNPFRRKNCKKGIQSRLLEPVQPEKSQKRYAIEVVEPIPRGKSLERYPIMHIGTRSAGKVAGRVPNRGCWNPYRGENLEKGTQSWLTSNPDYSYYRDILEIGYYAKLCYNRRNIRIKG
ncbi:hypothetical protein [Neobacillus soli]|uniref:hypothetical protein n=1 Tax=Neobacillus soli TaxID=220688 RepID=UPI000BB722B1|nr:hypothetical protein [Neobacillus soli]